MSKITRIYTPNGSVIHQVTREVSVGPVSAVVSIQKAGLLDEYSKKKQNRRYDKYGKIVSDPSFAQFLDEAIGKEESNKK